MSEPASFLDRLKQRKLMQWAAAYLAGAWLLLQVLDLLAGIFGWPAMVARSAVVLLAVGLVAAFIIAWFHGEQGEQKVRGIELLMLAAVCVLAGAAVAVAGRGARAARAGDVAAAAMPALVDDRAPAGTRVAEQGSVAVLPFVNLSSDKEQEYFSDGLTEELLNVLSRLPELRVAARTSAFSFKGRDVPVDSIARALHVANVVEGSVRRAGDSVRIEVRLVDAANGFEVWSDTYDRKLADIFAVQDEIAHSVVSALRIQLGGARGQRQLAKEETRDPQAHALLLKGDYIVRRMDRADVRQGIALLEEATRRDPGYARAFADLSQAYDYEAYAGYAPRSASLHAARQAAERALQLDSLLPETHGALGGIAFREDWDFRAATAHWRRAAELNPGFARAHTALGWLLAVSGRKEEAVAEARRAAELDPVSSGMLMNLGGVYFYTGQPELAVRSFQAALQLDPGNATVLDNLALTYAAMGRGADAVGAAERARDTSNAFSLATLAYAYGRAGRRTDALRAAHALEAAPDPSPYLLATAYAGLGDRERVIAYLQRAVAERDPPATDVLVDPVFDPFRGDPRLQAVVAEVGLR